MTAALVALFLASLAVTLAAAGVFARRLDVIGLRLGLPETLLGLLTALAADAPEVSSAVAALIKGDHQVGVGVVVGSNVFNLAAMVGLGAILCGSIRLRREPLVVEGAVGLAVLATTTALVAGWLAPAAAIAIIAVVVVPYVVLLATGPRGADRLPVGGRFLHRMFGEPHRPEGDRPDHGEAILRSAIVLVPALLVIVAGAALMVEAATRLADRWSVPDYLVGVLVLAILTSLPNAFTGIRLARAGRGSALLAETLNSNTINLVAGIALPALFVTVTERGGLARFDLAWLIGTTAVALGLLAPRRGATRAGGFLLVALYAVFVAVQVVYS